MSQFNTTFASAISNQTAWTVPSPAADATTTLKGDYWTTTDPSGTNWVYVSSLYGGRFAQSNYNTYNNQARFNQWISFTTPATNTTTAKYSVGQATTVFKGDGVLGKDD